MKYKFIFLTLSVFLFFACNTEVQNDTVKTHQDSVSDTVYKFVVKLKNEIDSLSKSTDTISPPPFTEDLFPCTECHNELTPNPKRRELVEMHDDIDAMFNHDKENRWCLDCHYLNNRDSLHLANGKTIAFSESQRLCGQCHGDKYRDWKIGVHGKRIGKWNGKKTYYLCVNCHNPHSPKFASKIPLPAPINQHDIKN